MERELRRRRWIVRRKIEGVPTSEISSLLGISERTVLRWWRAYRDMGWEGLEIGSRKPHTIHSTLPDLIERVLEIRKDTGYGPNKIEAVMKKEGQPISHNTIHKILSEHGMNNPIPRPRRIWGTRRFERTRSNGLWQTDFVLTEDDRWMVTFIDDHSRFVTGCAINGNATGENAIRLLKLSVKRYGVPEQILSDQGTQFVNQRGGTTEFRKFCIDIGIMHITGSKRRPTTTGKVERWHRTYQEESYRFGTLEEFVRHYNNERIHQSLGYLTPAEVYFRDRVTDVVG